MLLAGIRRAGPGLGPLRNLSPMPNDEQPPPRRADRRKEDETPLGARLLEDAEAMRRSGYEAIDRIVERWRALGDGPAWRSATRDVTEPLLDGPPPEEGTELEGLLATIAEDVMPLAGRIDHPRFMAFIPSSPTWASFLASVLTDGYNVFQGTWLESAGPSQIEVTVTDWFRRWMGYPAEAGGLFVSGGSAANLIALVAAREAAGNPERGTMYLSDQGHSSLLRAARIAGIPDDRVRIVPTDDRARIRPDRLRRAIRRDKARGSRPFFLVGSAGATNTGAIDPLSELALVARAEGLWFHVDAAYGGFAALDPESRPRLEGVERSDSVTLDPHKWFFQPYETGCLLVRDVARLEEAFRIAPEYLQDAEWGPKNVNFSDRGIQLTRSFRALRVWLSVHRYGLAAHREAIARAIAIARRTADRVSEEAELELLAPHSLGIVCFRYRGAGAALAEAELGTLNGRIQASVVESGHAMISSTVLNGRFSLRFCVMNARTTERDVHGVLDRILRVGRELEATGAEALAERAS